MRTILRSIRILLFALLVTCDAVAASSERTLLVFGDSLSAAHGLRAEQGWVVQLQQRLVSQGYGYRVVNASVSGETTSGGRGRIDRALAQHRPAVVLLELGGNDALRGLPIRDTRANLKAMIDAARNIGSKVLLLGIRIPPNYGAAYAQSVDAMYVALAAENKVPLVPFILEGFALDPRYMQEDGIHPNAAGQPKVLENVWPALMRLLEH
ncbi:MAG TPA: arylesterase [Steroidobacteraceae bacterium]|nr:arylesterase [Steroidobacteraceae bacterium]